MLRNLFLAAALVSCVTIASSGQSRVPSSPSKPFIVKTGRQLADIYREAEKATGNKQIDVVPAPGTQMRVAVFHDEKRENDLFEVHDASDDIYYVLDGEATLMLGGTLTSADEISPGEWRSKDSVGGQKIAIRKGDLVIVPRGTVHQRTVTGKGFSMILIKVFADIVKAQ